MLGNENLSQAHSQHKALIVRAKRVKLPNQNGKLIIIKSQYFLLHHNTTIYGIYFLKHLAAMLEFQCLYTVYVELHAPSPASWARYAPVSTHELLLHTRMQNGFSVAKMSPLLRRFFLHLTAQMNSHSFAHIPKTQL